MESTNTRKLALAAGVLYLVTFAASIPTLALKAPLVDHADWILGHGSDKGVILACLMDFICAVTGIGTAVALYPIVRRFSRTSSIGFITSRTLEAAILVMGAISLLTIVTLRTNAVGDTAALMTTSRSLIAAHHWAFLFGPGCMPAINAMFLATVMYRFRLVPRIIPLMGIVGAPMLLAAAVAVMFGGFTQTSTPAFLLTLPIATWEFSVGVYMIVKGVNVPAVAAAAPVASPCARRVTAMEQHNYDVVIVGGGAAGLSAALVLGRARRRVAVIDAGAPRNAPAAHMQGFLSRDGMPPLELLAAGRDEVAGYGVETVTDSVVKVDPGFVVHLASRGTVSARRILVTTGIADDLPAIPGVRERWGRDLLHCPYCHGWEVRDQPLGVLGTHPGAVMHAQLVRQWSDDVVFFTHTTDVSAQERAQLDARAIRVVDGEVVGLVVEADLLAGVALADGSVIARTAVFIRPRNVPHPGGLLAGLGVDVNAEGFVVVDRDGHTSTPGVWAAGNVVDPRASVIAAAGAAATAAMAINADLVQDDIQRCAQHH